MSHTVSLVMRLQFSMLLNTLTVSVHSLSLIKQTNWILDKMGNCSPFKQHWSKQLENYIPHSITQFVRLQLSLLLNRDCWHYPIHPSLTLCEMWKAGWIIKWHRLKPSVKVQSTTKWKEKTRVQSGSRVLIGIRDHWHEKIQRASTCNMWNLKRGNPWESYQLTSCFFLFLNFAPHFYVRMSCANCCQLKVNFCFADPSLPISFIAYLYQETCSLPLMSMSWKTVPNAVLLKYINGSLTPVESGTIMNLALTPIHVSMRRQANKI